MSKIESMGKISLGTYPTPLERMDNLSRRHGANLWIKRDDMTGPALGGNKTRKLEYVLKEALDGGYTTVLTEGGVQTNHGRTTIAACNKVGLKAINVLGGPKPEYLSGNLSLSAMMGAELVFCPDFPSIGKAIEETIARHEAAGEKVYFLPGGGTTLTGMVGYVTAVKEIMDQLDALDLHPEYLVCAAGSLGTYVGLNVGVKYYKAPFKILGIPVAPHNPEMDPLGLPFSAAKLFKEMSDFYELGLTMEPGEFLYDYGPADTPYCGEEYNKPDPLTREYMFELARTEGIILDPTYTGKAFRGFLDLADKGFFGDKPAIFLHTGGSPAMWTKEHLDDMQEQLKANCTLID